MDEPDSSNNQAELISKYQSILDANRIHETIISIDISHPPLQGEHMASVCLYITLTFSDGSAKELFVKEQPTNPAHLKMMKNWNLFEKEAGFFNSLLKDVQKYYLEHSASANGKPLDFFPTCFYADGKEIILENLVKEKGYYLNSKLERQDFESARMSLQNLARFHAIGYCMIKEVGGRDAFLEKYPCLHEVLTPTDPVVTSMFQNSINTSIRILNSSNVPGGKKVLERLEALKGKVNFDVVDLYTPKSSHLFNVINHGDCWNNNMLFRRDPITKELVHHVLIDFQVTRIGSPNMDLSYFLFLSLKTKLRRQIWRQLLEIYFNTLKSTIIQDMNHSHDFPFTFDQFLQDFISKVPIGFWFNSMFSIGSELLATIDLNKIEGDWTLVYVGAIRKWLEENPEKGLEQAEEIVQLWDELDELNSLKLST